MKKLMTLCLALIGFGLGMQDVSAQTEIKKTEKTSITKAHDLAKTLNLDSETSETFLKVLEKHFTYLEYKKDDKNIDKLKEKIGLKTDEQLKKLLTKEQYIKFKKSKLY